MTTEASSDLPVEAERALLVTGGCGFIGTALIRSLLENEPLKLRDLRHRPADKVVRVGRARGHDVQIKQIENPRVEKEDHYYNPTYTGLKELGLDPHPLTDEVLAGMFEIVERFKDNICEHKIFRGIKW